MIFYLKRIRRRRLPLCVIVYKMKKILLFLAVCIVFLGSAGLALASQVGDGCQIGVVTCDPPASVCANPNIDGIGSCQLPPPPPPPPPGPPPPGSSGSITLPNPLCTGGPGSPGCINSFTGLLTQITTYILNIIGGLAVIMFIWAGILFVTSAGDPSKITKARHVVIYAIIGIAIALAGKGLIAVITEVIGSSPP